MCEWLYSDSHSFKQMVPVNKWLVQLTTQAAIPAGPAVNHAQHAEPVRHVHVSVCHIEH